jgi:hypothetical protein
MKDRAVIPTTLSVTTAKAVARAARRKSASGRDGWRWRWFGVGVEGAAMRSGILALSVLVGCASAVEVEDTDASPPTFTEVYSEVLAPSCAFSSCHGPASAGYLGWSDAATAHAALVDQASAAASERVLVVPGDPESSYLLDKLLGAEGISGDPMPPPVGGLDAAKIELVRAWIAAGAAND